MFVRDQDGVERFDALADRGQPLRGLAHAETGIHQDARPLRRHQRRISRTAARQHAKFNDRPPPLNTSEYTYSSPNKTVRKCFRTGQAFRDCAVSAVTALRKNPYLD